MATVRHSFVSAIPDSGDTSIVQPSDWNADHIVEGVREQLTADRTYYVRTDGSDSNTGLANTAGGAWLTLQHAWDTICDTLDQSGYTVTISIANGTYVGILGNLKQPSGNININGNIGSPSSVIITPAASNSCLDLVNCFYRITLNSIGFSTANFEQAIEVFNSVVWVVDPYWVNTSGSGGFFITAYNGSYVYVYNDQTAEFDVSGTFRMMVAIYGFAQVDFYPNILDLTAVTNIATSFVTVESGYASFYFTVGFTGTPTGKRYTAALNGVVNTFGGGATYLPGGTAGTTATGGQYV